MLKQGFFNIFNFSRYKKNPSGLDWGYKLKY